MENSNQTNPFDQLKLMSTKQFCRANKFQFSELNADSFLWINNVLDQNLCSVFAEQLRSEPVAFTLAPLVDRLVSMIMTEPLDRYLISYLQSEYAIVALRAYNKGDDENVSTVWQCENQPEQQLKLRLYIEASDANNGLIIDRYSTEQLKNKAFGFNDNSADLTAFCTQHDLSIEPTAIQPIKAGSAMLYNPSSIAFQDSASSTQAYIEISFIQSPYHWKYSKDSILKVATSDHDLTEKAQALMDHAIAQKPYHDVVTLFPPTSSITSAEQLRTLLLSIFPKTDFGWQMFTRLIALDPELKQLTDIGALVETLKLSFQNSIDWSGNGRLGSENIENLKQLSDFEQRFDDSSTRYGKKGKPDPSAIFWPNPHPNTEDNRPPLSRFDQLPFVKRYPLVNKDTPIGSAGSCFAQEIAKVFQEEEYNYIVTERNDDPAAGMVVDNYQQGDKYAIACANYGILFNTPSFRQLAERAFNVRPTQKILFQRDDGLWLDPYRENVGFVHQQAYINDYQNHLDATRKALEQSEVFIITLGLNECWELQDGSVLSRNPQRQVYALAKHKTLSVQENVDNIQAFFDTVRQYNPNFKLIITLSPIPFLATGHAAEQHVITANTHSKAVLRVAAHELVENNEDMYYLPSYELVTQCIKEPWQDDDRHVTRDTVKQVVNLFKEIFTY